MVALRYVLLFSLALGSFAVLVSVSVTTGHLLFINVGETSVDSNQINIWALLVLALLGFISLLKFAFRGFPKMISNWFTKHKERLITLALGFLVCFIFVMT